MKFTCNKENLSEAIQNVSRAVSSKSTILALEGILIKAKGGEITLTGYDLELGITTVIDATVPEDGDIILSAKLFGDMIRRMPAETVSIESDEKLLTQLDSGAAHYTIMGLDPGEFPEIPTVMEVDNILISEALLKSMIDQTLFAVAVSDSKPIHKGSMFELRDGVLTVVSVDGYRLALRREKLPKAGDCSFVVPGKTLSEISKLVSDGEESVNISVSKAHIIFRVGKYNVISRLLEGEFLDYKAAIPQNDKTEINISTRQFMDSVERISLLISDKLRSPLKVRFEDETIKFSCSTSIGKANDEISCKKTGEDVDIGFNSKYLLDALRVCSSDKVILQLGGPLSPMKIVPKEGDSFLFLVLPVRLKNE